MRKKESTKFLGALNTELVNENLIHVEEAVVVFAAAAVPASPAFVGPAMSLAVAAASSGVAMHFPAVAAHLVLLLLRLRG